MHQRELGVGRKADAPAVPLAHRRRRGGHAGLLGRRRRRRHLLLVGGSLEGPWGRPLLHGLAAAMRGRAEGASIGRVRWRVSGGGGWGPTQRSVVDDGLQSAAAPPSTHRSLRAVLLGRRPHFAACCPWLSAAACGRHAPLHAKMVPAGVQRNCEAIPTPRAPRATTSQAGQAGQLPLALQISRPRYLWESLASYDANRDVHRVLYRLRGVIAHLVAATLPALVRNCSRLRQC